MGTGGPPQPTMVPSRRKARLWPKPAAIATTLLRPGGTRLGGPPDGSGMFPHSTIVPLLCSASEWKKPADTATASVKPAGTIGPPKLTTVPGVDNLNVCDVTASSASALVAEP